jgi:hypothetical protein
MAQRIANCGVITVKHVRVTNLSFYEPTCFSDFEALIFDPAVITGARVPREAFLRRQAEVGDLVNRKGGLLVCVLRPPGSTTIVDAGNVDALSVLDTASIRAVGMVREALRSGTTTQWNLVKGASRVAAAYLRALDGGLNAEAFVQADEARLKDYGGTSVAANSVGWPVSVEFLSGTGRICFVPVLRNDRVERLGSALTQMVEEHYGGAVEIEAPPWVEAIVVPGANARDAEIARLKAESLHISGELAHLDGARSELLSFRVLLYGYGKSLLEPVVRRALRKVGFKILEPEDYRGEWDVDLTDRANGASAVGEIEGSDGAIRVDKLRQLLNYVEAEEDAGRKRKGILVGNGYRSKPLNEPERSSQFTEKVLGEAKGFGYCLLPTTELFAAVCAVLDAPSDETLQKHIRDSILSTVGVWTFTRPAEAGDSASPCVG